LKFPGLADLSEPLRDTYQQLEQAEALRMQGQIDRARELCEALVRRYPDYFGALYTLGLIYVDKEHYPQALGFLVRAAMLNPHSWRALTALSAVYLKLGANEMAARTLEQAVAINPDDPSILLTLGEIYREEREYELARDAYRKSYELDPSLEAAAIGLGNCCAHLGLYAEASEIFEGLLKRGMRSVSTLSELIDLPTSFVTLNLQKQFARIAGGGKADHGNFKSLASFVQAIILHNAGRHAEAWEHLVAANREQHTFVMQDAAELAEMQRANLAQLKEKHIKVAGSGGKRDRPISLFILGPSRSGKTTMEALAGALDGVKRGYENPSVENSIRRTFQGAGLLTAGMFEMLPPRLDSMCRDSYVKELAQRAGSAKVFTNTHPGRIHDASRVAAAFPDVRFIFVKRNLQDNMLRIYMRKYAFGNPYGYDLAAIRDHITWYHEMIDVLAEKLPGIARVVHYEDIVADPRAALEIAADLCGLPMEHGPPPNIGDDRGCAEPYRDFMVAALTK
jgi:tetratricopeptide (TPR) repeat protein